MKALKKKTKRGRSQDYKRNSDEKHEIAYRKSKLKKNKKYKCEDDPDYGMTLRKKVKYNEDLVIEGKGLYADSVGRILYKADDGLYKIVLKKI